MPETAAELATVFCRNAACSALMPQFFCAVARVLVAARASVSDRPLRSASAAACLARIGAESPNSLLRRNCSWLRSWAALVSPITDSRMTTVPEAMAPNPVSVARVAPIDLRLMLYWARCEPASSASLAPFFTRCPNPSVFLPASSDAWPNPFSLTP
jgi:hypothetical protein